MTTPTGSHGSRSAHAERLLSDLPHGGKEAVLLRVQCSRNHHVAVVYRTADGLVYAAPVRARSHGAHDLPDEPHHGRATARWLDLLHVPGADDALPAWCDCGPRSLSRAAVARWVDEGEHRVVVD